MNTDEQKKILEPVSSWIKTITPTRGIILLIIAILIVHAVLISLLFVGLGSQAEEMEKQKSVLNEPQIPERTLQEEEENEPAPEQPTGTTTPVKQPGKVQTRPEVPAKKVMLRNLDFSRSVTTVPNVPEIPRIRAGILVDMDNGTVLWAKNANSPVPIASMTKIMTMLLAYEATQDNTNGLTLDSKIKVTKESTGVPPSGVGLRMGEVFPLRALLLAAAVRSANDSAVLIAQAVSGGSVDAFIRMMNARASELGMSNTRYFNPHGLPGRSKIFDNYASVSDMVRLCSVFMSHDFLRSLVSTRTADFRTPGTKDYQRLINHNNLLPKGKVAAAGVDGIKTGYTNRAQSCVAASCIREGRRLLLIIAGAPSQRDRDLAAKKLLNWGYQKLNVPLPQSERNFMKSCEPKSAKPAPAKSSRKSAKKSRKR